VFDAPALAAVLGDALGVRIVVEKARRVLRRGTVRIHVDDVAGLGRFVELEALATEVGGLEVERDRIEDLRARLGLDDDALLVPMGYAELLERRGRGILAIPG
jgi:adenylate cyclase, class 2